jgi:hypothetical protein
MRRGGRPAQEKAMNRRTLLTTISAVSFVLLPCAVVRSDEPGSAAKTPMDSIPVASHRQLFIDDFLFASHKDVTLTRHNPRLEEVVFAREKPWEHKQFHYTSVVREDDRFRMWYRVEDAKNITHICYAESSDGIHWEKPNLGLVPWKGSRQNNIVIPSESVPRSNGVSVVIDPTASADERYKMITSTTLNIWAYVSADGLTWRPASTKPLFDSNRYWGFDSHNVLL